MDALPIQEQTGLDFASQNEGKMHACGHDIHTTTLLGVAAVLQELAPQLAGTVRLLFQPAEEALGGAAAMIADGALEGVDMALGFHNHPDMPAGSFGFARGACLAAGDRFDITVHGISGHAAHPDDAVDPIVAACQLVTQLQTVVSREVKPIYPCVVTVGAIHAGTVANIIPDSCVLRGTVRTLHAPARERAETAIRRLCAGLEAGMRVRCEVNYRHGVPPLVNDDGVLDRAVASVRAQFGDVVVEGSPSLGGEDFALMANLVPAFQLRIGSSQPGRHDKLHNSAYQPDEACIGFGVQALSQGRDGPAGVRVCVYGAGAIGGHFAWRLAKGGAEVSVVARGAQLAAIQAQGLRVQAPDREGVAVVAAAADPAALGPQDAVIVTTKAPALPQVAAGIGPLLGPATPVVFAMNGIPWFYFHGEGGRHDGMRLEKLDPGGALEKAVGPARAVAGVVYSACTVIEPGLIHVESDRSRLVIGPANGAMAAESGRAGRDVERRRRGRPTPGPDPRRDLGEAAAEPGRRPAGGADGQRARGVLH